MMPAQDHNGCACHGVTQRLGGSGVGGTDASCSFATGFAMGCGVSRSRGSLEGSLKGSLPSSKERRFGVQKRACQSRTVSVNTYVNYPDLSEPCGALTSTSESRKELFDEP
jgi:hypothetical protein